jgi:hypothetical protein
MSAELPFENYRLGFFGYRSASCEAHTPGTDPKRQAAHRPGCKAQLIKLSLVEGKPLGLFDA